MLLEIQIAVSFLTSYLYNKLPRRRVDLFSVDLAKYLKEKFDGHWYIERPSKGSGFRSLLIGDDLDPVLIKAATNSGLSLDEVRTSLPDKLTLWIDPDEVSYRIDDQPLVKIIYQKDKYGEKENLAELESINAQHYTTTNARSRSAQLYQHSPQQSNRSPPNRSPSNNVYSPWAAQDFITTTTEAAIEVDSRLSPNAQEFNFTTPTKDYLFQQQQQQQQQDVFATSSLWSNSGDERRSNNSLHSLYNWFNSDAAYKHNYTSSQLEIMA